MLLLAIETATDVCSVALMQGDRVTVELALRRPRAHAETLTPMIQQALRYGEVAPRDLDAVAVSSGPGSYTGLRIGVSTAKGLALAADVPLVAVPSLEALAASVMAAPGEAICALFNARRDEVYAVVFLVGQKNDTLERLTETTALAVDDLPTWLEAPKGTRLWLVGEGVPRALSVLEDRLALRPLDPSVFVPSAASVARLARPRLAEGRVEDIAGFEPFYLKEFVAKKPQSSIFEKLPF